MLKNRKILPIAGLYYELSTALAVWQLSDSVRA